MRHIAFGIASLTIAGLSGCSTPEASGSCASSEDCLRGTVCQADGACGDIACDSNSDCESSETCLQENSDGAFDPDADGVCSDEECRTDRDCEGGVCINQGCYEGEVEPSTCTCRDECATGNACIQGSCRAELGPCASDCECAVGNVCTDGTCAPGSSLCDTVACPEGERCDSATGSCVSACDPACTGGQTCNTATNTCEGEAGGGLCTPCTSNDDCGGPADACLGISAEETICGRSCVAATDCPGGFVCFDTGAAGIGMQCVPAGGTCSGCLATGCPGGQFCDPGSGACNAVLAECEACTDSVQCGPEGACELGRAGRVCVARCPEGSCGEGFTCTAGVCIPDATACGGGSCDLTCAPPLGVLDPVRCLCLGCLTDTDCAEGQQCNTGGTCVVAGGRPCSTTSECDGGYCQGGVCVECLTPGDCMDEEVCRAGACVPCDCPEGERCTAAGTCEEIPDPSSCTSDSQCVGIANTLGYTGEGATCDSTYGCITAGVCNGTGGGLGLPLPDLGFGGTTDPFDAPCTPSTTCTANITIEGIFSGTPTLFSYQCVGCVVGDDSTCRQGETCTTPLIPLFGSTPYCSTGGGGFPLPFP